ncbi:ABC transporter substrate-binding protein [Mycobacterium sp. AT1]|uniref:ABC transporter substrate-binding protein n=1 Tax=Mycobacterium sp. AT1 TaxID=1961706 RepID=UPI0009AE69BB|nr:extracellular solute-binding protein [Mycobacterium sp. AT1]OPX05245.1 hypothetical protein B1790_32890 [Mycobacterium sp. AT1]
MHRRWNRSKLAVAAIALLTANMLAACGSSSTAAEVVTGPWDSVVDAANAEGQVNFYSVMSTVQNKRLVDAFNQKYPNIRVAVTRGAGELPPRVEAEITAKSDGADVFLYSDRAWFSNHADQLVTIDGPSINGWRNDSWEVPSKAIIPSSYPYSMLVWNTNKFPDGFKTWDQLLDPSVKGSLGLRGDVTTSMAGFLDFQSTQLGNDYMVRLGAQQPKYYTSVVPMTQAIAAGEIGVSNTSMPSVVKELQSQGAPIQSLIPDPAFWSQWGAGVLSKSYRPNAARVFLDFVMSPEGQTALNGDGFGAAGRDGIAGTIQPQGATMLDSKKYSSPAVIEEFQAKFTKWFS